MSEETVLDSKRLSYGRVELVKVFSFPGTITYWIKIEGVLKYGSYRDESDARAKYNSLW